MKPENVVHFDFAAARAHIEGALQSHRHDQNAFARAIESVLEAERRRIAPYRRLLDEGWFDDATHQLAGFGNASSLKALDHLIPKTDDPAQRVRSHLERLAFYGVVPDPEAKPSNEDQNQEAAEELQAKKLGEQPRPESQAEFRERMRDENPDYAY